MVEVIHTRKTMSQAKERQFCELSLPGDHQIILIMKIFGEEALKHLQIQVLPGFWFLLRSQSVGF